KTTGTTEEALLINHKPEPHVRCLPSKSITLATLLIISAPHSGWLPLFVVCYWNAERHRIGSGQVVQYFCALIHRYQPHVRRLPSESTTLATPLIIYYKSVVSFSGWLLAFLACHWNAEGHRIGCSQVAQHVCALTRRHTPACCRQTYVYRFCGSFLVII
uniref:G_PROTEIN_RECEP_F1_2 domain-containing protein n=1 Tax=Mesocestoides corti TaxID=53468 RepID=A0A5K3FXZ7_MESCO